MLGINMQGKSLDICLTLSFWFVPLTGLTSSHLPIRCVWVPDPIKSEDHACFWLCFRSRWNLGTGAADLQQGTVPTVSETDWTHHKVSDPGGKHTFTQIMNTSIKAFIISVFCSGWQCAMSATTGQSMLVWLARMDPAHTLCPWTNYSWSTTIFSSELFYMSSKTKGKKFTSVL